MVSCSFDYREAQVPEDLEDTIPNIVLKGFRQTVVSKGKVVLRIQVDKAEGFERKKRTIFHQVEFSEFDEDGALLTEGRADQVVYESDTKNATVSGNIRIHSLREEGTIHAETLSWNDKERTLTSPEGDPVRLEDEKGSWIEGKGFTADLKRLQVAFSGPVRGEYVVEER
ncbi:MAG: hypothetical protein Kow009_04370 [Spirochaetales bacterium]